VGEKGESYGAHPFMPLFTRVRGIGLLGSPDAETRISPDPMRPVNPLAECGYGPVHLVTSMDRYAAC
jgi:hypothetical protein